MKNNIKKINIIELIMLIFLLSGLFQNITICTIIGFNMKLVHLISLFFIPILISKRKELTFVSNKYFTFYLAFILLQSLIVYYFYGFNKFFANYIFAIYTLIIIVNVGKNISKEKWIKIINIVAIIFLSCVYIKLIVNYKSIISFLGNYLVNTNTNDVRLLISTFIGGGINIEATWIAILGFSFTQNKRGAIYFFFSLIIAILYSSRAAMLLNVLLAMFLIIAYIKRKKMDTRRILKMLLILCIIALILAIIMEILTGLISYSIDRFLSIGNENGSIGRLNMWKHVWNAFSNNPIGYGIGNAINSIENISHIRFAEDNVHNLFFQNLLDSGVIGFCLYLGLNIGFIVKERKNIFNDPIIQMIFAYICISILEFRGAEFILYYVIGIYFLISKKGVYNEAEK